MAWDHNARNRSAEVRRVNYHEDGPSKSKNTSSSSNRGGNNSGGDGGGLGPVGKVILGGVAIYIAGQVGLGWIMDVKDKIDTANEIKEAVKQAEKDAKASDKAEKKLQKDLESGGYTAKFDIDEDELEPGDIADFLENIDEFITEISAEETFSDYEKVYLSSEVFDNSANFEYAVLNRLDLMNEKPVMFIIRYENISDKKMEKEWENARTINKNNTIYVGQYGYTKCKLKGMMCCPDSDDMTLFLTYYDDSVSEEMEEVINEAGK